MPGIYRPRHPERTVLYRVLLHYFDKFMAEYEQRFEKEYGYFRPIIKEVVEKYLDCGNPKCGFARIRCPDCEREYLLCFSCKSRGFCPSCHAKRLEEWGEWVREKLFPDVPHRQVVFTIPKMLRLLFKYKRKLLIPDKGQVMIRYYGLYANAHRGKVRKKGLSPFALRMVEEELKSQPSKGWTAMIRKVYEVDPLLCPQCGGTMKIIAFITDYDVVDRITDHLKLTFVAEKPPPSHVFEQIALMAAETRAEYF